ncbi:hypothetical protein ABZ622_21150 [Streptomyces sp. NPDC007164]|uniref:hypothetical protein n=1 Tax=Streptomyces sp. NPDC007164 TaxID=3156918 RepID=UPI0033CC8530
MRNTLRRALFATTVAAAAFGFAATSASATALAQWTVVNPNANGTFTAQLKAGTVATLVDTNTSQQVDCSVGTASGTAPSGTYSTGVGIAKITAAAWGSTASPCPGPLGSNFTASLASGAVISIDASSYSGGITSGSLSGVKVNLTGDTILGTCKAVISGSVSNVTYNNATGELDINTGTGLKVNSADNCSGLLNAGDSATFDATYKVAAPLTITSP